MLFSIVAVQICIPTNILPITTIFQITDLPATKTAFDTLYCTQLSSFLNFSNIPILEEDIGFTLQSDY